MWSAGDEPAGWIHMDDGLVIHELRRQRRPNYDFFDPGAQLRGRHLVAVLARHDNRVDSLGHVTVVLHGNLRLAIGPEIRQYPVAPRLR